MTQPYPMQMKHRELSRQEAFEILEEGEFATISTVDPDGTPYGVPVSYVMMDEKLYIHTGKRPGHKIDVPPILLCWLKMPFKCDWFPPLSIQMYGMEFATWFRLSLQI